MPWETIAPCCHFPRQLKLGRGQSHDTQRADARLTHRSVTGPLAVIVECECGRRWDFIKNKEVMSVQELEVFLREVSH